MYQCILLILRILIGLKTIGRFLSSKNGRYLVIYRLNFEFGKIIYWLGHSVLIKSSAVKFMDSEHNFWSLECS